MTPQRNAQLGLTLGLVLMIGAPAAGLVGTVVQLTRSFDAVANVPPEQKADLLSQRIGHAMTFTVVGLGAVIPGLALTILSVRALRAARTPRQSASL